MILGITASSINKSSGTPEYPPKYYIANSGADTNNGLTPETAWKSMTKLNSMMSSFIPGDVVGFNRGDTFGQDVYLLINGVLNSSPSAPIVFTSYGAGDKPKIDVTKIYTGGWIDRGNNIWESDSSLKSRRIKIDGVEILMTENYSELGTNVSESGTDPDGFVEGYVNYSTSRISLYSTTSPATKQVMYMGQNRGAYVISVKNIVFDDLEFVGGYYNNFDLASCDNITFNNCKFGVMANHGIAIYRYGGTNVVSTNVIIKNSLFDTEFVKDYNSVPTDEFKAEQRGGADALNIQALIGGSIFNNVMKNWGHGSIFLTSSTTTTDTVENIKSYNNYLYMDPKMCYGGASAADRRTYNCEFYNNTFEGCKASQINGIGNHWHHNLVLNTKQAKIHTFPSGVGIDVGSYTLPTYNNVIENNVFYRCESGGIRFTHGGETLGYENYNQIIRNNIFYECGWGNTISPNTSVHFKYGPLIHDITFLNNLVFSSATENTVVDGYGGVYYYPGSVLNGTITLTYATYGTGQNNIFLSPVFVAEGSDYNLEVGSPGIDDGAVPLSTRDFNGNIIPYLTTDPDIGAYEYGYTSTDPVDTTAPTWSGNNLSYANLSSNSVTLNWTPATDNVAVTNYLVYLNNVLLSTLGNVLTFNVEALTQLTEYTFYVKAKDAAGNISLQSNTLTVTTTASGGVNVVRNGTFDSAAEWTMVGASNISAGTLNIVSDGSDSSGSQLNVFTAGTYQYSFDVTVTSGSLQVYAGSAPMMTFSTSGTKTGSITIPSGSNLLFRRNTACNIKVDNVVFTKGVINKPNKATITLVVGETIINKPNKPIITNII